MQLGIFCVTLMQEANVHDRTQGYIFSNEGAPALSLMEDQTVDLMRLNEVTQMTDRLETQVGLFSDNIFLTF